VKTLLGTDLKVDVWDEGVFGLGNSYLEELLKAVDTYDFAVFVFAPDARKTMRATRRASVRDNVLFELGLFMGRLGRHRAFWLVPRRKDRPKIPSDLEGISRADFDSAPVKRPESLKMACRKLKAEARKQGRRPDEDCDEIETPRVLCAASAQWAAFGFDDDVAAVEEAFGKPVVTVERALEPNALAQLLTSAEWPIVHRASRQVRWRDSLPPCRPRATDLACNDRSPYRRHSRVISVTLPSRPYNRADIAPYTRHTPRRLRHHRADRRRRDGSGVSGDGHQAETSGRD
jgi:CAP12/Pycsar effector protein, TIR domain